MKNSLALCSLALNPNAPSPTASMVRISDGRMEAFGGTFCIAVPCPVDVGACFNPSLFATFFRKERKAVAYTLKKGKLTAQEGKEKLTIPCLPPEEMVTIDVYGDPTPVELDLTYLKVCADVVDPVESRVAMQGVSFRNGMMEATNGRIIVSAVTELEFPEFILPVDSAKALMKFKSPVTGMAVWEDGNMVKFFHKDGSTLTSLLIEGELPDTSPFYAGEWSPLKLKDAADFAKIECERVIFEDGNATYIQEKSRGIIEGVCATGVAVTLSKKALDTLLRVSSDIRVESRLTRVMAVSENCRVISTTMGSSN